MYDQASSRSSTCGFSHTPSPGPLTPTSSQVIINNVEVYQNHQKSESPPRLQNNNDPVSYNNYSTVYQSQPSPVKLTPMNDDAISDFDIASYCDSPGVSPLKTNNRQFIKASKLVKLLVKVFLTETRFLLEFFILPSSR